MIRRLRAAIAAAALVLAGMAPASAEVFYQIFPRSFADSNGDRQGDLKGLTARLGYIKALGVTSILLTPLQPSPFYHNYFATDFAGIDRDYGTLADYRAFVRAAHARGLKVYLDLEIQYVAQGHPWLEEARGNPRSRWSRFVLWNKPGNRDPEPFLNQPTWPTWDGRRIAIAMVDLKQPAVQAYFARTLRYWIDPAGDGSLREGVDGFRIDHMMDDLDHKHRLTNLFAAFWTPLIARWKAINPRFRVLAEQSDWGYGDNWLARGHADAVFAFPLRAALAKLDKKAIEDAIRTTAAKTPAGKSQIVFLENHDTDRFASLQPDPRKQRLAAALSLLLAGDPLIYYGQELGMRGKVRAAGLSDAAHIPLREAFRWQRDLDARGSAIWYRPNVAAWNGRYNRSNDGVSVAEQDRDPQSLLAWYRRLLALRAARVELREGAQRLLCESDATLLCVERAIGVRRTLLVANLGEQTRSLPRDDGLVPAIAGANDAIAPWSVAVLASR